MLCSSSIEASIAPLDFDSAMVKGGQRGREEESFPVVRFDLGVEELLGFQKMEVVKRAIFWCPGGFRSDTAAEASVTEMTCVESCSL